MSQHPEISIIIPVWNGQKYISDLFSLFGKQSRPECWELILVDDGSTDGTSETVEAEIASGKINARLIRQENAGASAARNTGAAAAAGTYLAFMDVDDAVSPDYTGTLLALAENASFDVAVFGSERITDPDTLKQRLAEARPESEPNTASVTPKQQLTDFWQNPTKLGIYNLLLRRDFLADHGISYPVGHTYYEDYDYMIQAFAQAESILRADRVLYYYILQEGSLMGKFNPARVDDLEMIGERTAWLSDKCPGFAPYFAKWGVSRLYWSVLWQAALAFSKKDFHRFAAETGAREQLQLTRDFPDRRVRLSSRAFLLSPGLYRAIVRRAGRAKSKIQEMRYEEYLAGSSKGGAGA